MTRLEWFQKRIGKKVFRQKTNCCSKCDNSYEKGVDVIDKSHAQYLFEIECSYQADGVKMMYFETKKQADNFASWVVSI